MTDLLITAVLPAGTWDVGLATDEIVLDFDSRFRRRIKLRSERGADVLLDLPHAVRLRHDDGLQGEDGSVVRVSARHEALHEITAADATTFMRIAWHLGNRHLPVQFIDAAIRIRADHVIADMVLHLGGAVHAVEAPFDPEAGAYAGGHHHHGDDE